MRQVYSERQVLRHTRLPVVLLMGCSSGRRRLKGECDGEGVVDAYINHSGSQVVVANLWDITDGDGFIMTSELLTHWLHGEEGDD